MAQCSKTTIATPSAKRLYRNGVEMQVSRDLVQCPAVATVTFRILGKTIGYCGKCADERRAWISEVVNYGITPG